VRNGNTGKLLIAKKILRIKEKKLCFTYTDAMALAGQSETLAVLCNLKGPSLQTTGFCFETGSIRSFRAYKQNDVQKGLLVSSITKGYLINDCEYLSFYSCVSEKE